MTQEEKNLLLKDLCARLPYGVMMKGVNEDFELSISVSPKLLSYALNSADFKPYLRPVSTMTMEEQFQLGKLLGAATYNLLKGEYSSLKELLEYSYKNHIDLFGLIPKGLAIEAPEDMYNI